MVACTPKAPQPIVISEAWAPAFNETSASVPVYFSVTNNTDQSVKLIQALSPLADQVRIARLVYRNGKYEPYYPRHLSIAAESTLALSPRGFFLELSNFYERRDIGENFELVLEFNNAHRVVVQVAVVAQH